MKKMIFTAVISAVLMSAAVSANAAEEEPRLRVMGTRSESSVLYTDLITSDECCAQTCRLLDTTLLERFREETEFLEEYIEIGEYHIKEEDIGDVYGTLALCSPRSYYLMGRDGTYSYMYDAYPVDDEWIIDRIYPIYRLDVYDDEMYLIPEKAEALLPEVTENMAVIDAELDRMLAYVSDSRDEFTAAVRLHNYICSNFVYDRRENGEVSNTAYTLITERTGQCQSYSVLFNYAAMELGLETGFVTSYLENGRPYHTWNLIRLGDEENNWYHADVTWDDTEDGEYGLARMRYFLLSDSAMSVTHNNVETGYGIASYSDIGVVTGTRYDNAPWRFAISGVESVYGQLYFVRDAGDGYAELCSVPTYDAVGEPTVLYRYEMNWSIVGCYTGLAIVDGVLYFNDAHGIHSYDLNGGYISAGLISPAVGGSGELYGCYADGTTVYYGMKPDPESSTENGGSVEIAEYSVSEPIIEDGAVTVSVEIAENAVPAHKVILYVCDGGVVRMLEHDGGSGELSLPVESGETPRVFVWDENMRPYV